MSLVTTPIARLPFRIQSLISLSSVIIRIQPISSLLTAHQPIRDPAHFTPQPSQAYHTTSAPGSVSASQFPPQCGSQGVASLSSGENSNRPIGSQYMCGNSYSTMASSNPAVIQPSGTHTATVIFLHGLGDTGHGWLEAFDSIKEPHIKYICPHAGQMKVTLNMGMVMPSWFDIKSLGFGAEEDEPGIKNASGYLLQLVAAEEAKGITPNRIVIGGFSQGGAVSLYTALTDDRPLAGLIGLSTWMPLYKGFKTEGVTKKDLPVLQCHGTADPLLNFQIAEMTHGFLKTQVTNPEFKHLQGIGHSSSPEEMKFVKEFLKKVLP